MDAVTAEMFEEKPRKTRAVKRRTADNTTVLPASDDQADAEGKIPRTPLRSDPVVTLFFVCLVAGLAITVLALFQDEDLKRFGLMGPFLATGAYPVIGLVRGIATRPAQRERFADNCYYLGFIFTQAALFFAFLPSTFLGRALEARDVLGFFGMALSAALTGLMARTILVQLGSSLPEAEDAVHQEVDEVAKQVAERSRKIVSQFQLMADAAGEVTSAMEAGLDQLTASIGRFDDVLRQELASFEAGAETVDAALTDAQQDLKKHQESFGEHVSEAARALRDLQANLSARSAEALGSLKAATSALEIGSRALGEFNELNPRLDVIEAQLGGVEKFAEEFDQLSGRLAQELKASATNMGEELRAAAQAGAAQVATAAEKSAGTLEGSASQAAGELQRTSQAFEQDLAATSERLTAALTVFKEELARLKEPSSGSTNAA